MWTDKGVALNELGNYEAAIVCYDEALRINPKNANAWYNKGVTLGKLGNFEGALEHFGQCPQHRPAGC